MARVTRLELATLKGSDILDRARKSFGQEKIKLNNEIKTIFLFF